jgi:hypothetical protein
MRWTTGVALAVACAVAGFGTARAEGTKIDCKETDLEFDAPGFTVDCKDFSRSSISVGEMNAATRTYSLFAMSEADLTFLNVFSNHVLGGTRLYFNRTSLESDIEEHFTGKFSGWTDAEDAGDYTVKTVDATFKSGDPMECVAFRKLGARRQEGVSGMTVGFACSDSGREKALDAMKRFTGETE